MEILEHALHVATDAKQLRAVCFLAKYVSVSCVNGKGETALAVAARNGYLEIVNALMKCGSFLDARAADG